MMWFDEIMKDCKEALRISSKYKEIFIPLFINLGLLILLGIFLIISSVFMLHNIIKAFTWDIGFFEVLKTHLHSILILIVVTYFFVTAGSSLIKAGSINLYQKATSNTKPKTSDFLEGIKLSFLNILKGTIFVHILFLLVSPIALGFFIIYSMTIGILTGGWGIWFLASIVAVFLASWPIIVVVENIKPWKAIRLGLKLGKKYFPGLFLVMLANILIVNYLVTLLGPLGAVLTGWLVNGAVGTYFSIVILLIYNRIKQKL